MDKTEKRSRYLEVGFLVIILCVGLALHLFRISYPASPVFDEAHFATYSADYLTGHVFDDVHPPLGKFIYAAALSFYSAGDLADSQFSTILKAPDGTLTVVANDIPYGNFPYVTLRLISALFGVLLPVAFYFFMKNIGAGRIAASLSAAFVLFDNAFLLNSRLILMDAMLIFFGVVGLALYFSKRRFAVAGGMVWGLALAVKLTGVVFAGPLIAAYFLARGRAERKKEFARIAQFAAAGFVVLTAVAFAGTLFFPTSARLNELSLVGFLKSDSAVLTSQWQTAHPVKAYFLADTGEFVFSISNYIVGSGHDGASPWYFWPAGQSPIVFYTGAPGGSGQSGDRNILFTGNLILWLAATLAVIMVLAVFFRHFWEHHKERADHRTFFILLAGYVFAMLPFVIFIHRSTFLYHYLPALIFAFGLLAWFIAHWLKVRDWSDLSPRAGFILAMIMVAVILGFLAVAPLTYGL